MADDNRDLVRDLSRLIKGEVALGDLTKNAEKLGFESFSELCEARLPSQLARVRIGTRDLLAKIDRWRRRGISLGELHAWADELYHVSFNHRIGYEARVEELVTSALSAISIVANERLFPNAAKAQRSIEYIRACLLRRKRLQLRNIFLRIFEDLEVAHLANKHFDDAIEGEEDADERPPFLGGDPPRLDLPGDEEDIASRWADVVLLDKAYEADRDIFTGYDWLIAFTVTSRSLYDAEQAADLASEGGAAPLDLDLPPASGEKPAKPAEAAGPAPAEEKAAPAPAAEEAEEAPAGPKRKMPGRIRPTPREPGPVVDRVPALRRLVPNFDFDRWKPRYLYDGDGIAEIVLDAPKIGPAEVRYATKLFCLANRVRAAFLDGEAVKTLVVRPGAGRSARRAG